MLLSLEDELAVLDLRYADLLHSVHSLSASDEDDAEVHMYCLTLTQLRDKSCPPSLDPAPTPSRTFPVNWAFSALTSYLTCTLLQG